MPVDRFGSQSRFQSCVLNFGNGVTLSFGSWVVPFTEPASPHAYQAKLYIPTVGLHEEGKQGHGL